MHITAHVDFFFVLDSPVAHVLELRQLEIVGRVFVGHDALGVFAHMVRNDLIERVSGRVRNVDVTYFSAALTDSDYNFLVQFLALVPVLLSSDVSLVHLHDASELRRIFDHHCLADAVRQIPRGAVLYPECPPQLIGRDSLLRFCN